MAQSGQLVIDTAGTEERFPSTPCEAAAFKPLPANTGIVYIGNNGDDTVSSSTGFPLEPGETIIVEGIKNLAQFLADVSVNGEGVAWIIVR